MAFRRLLRGQIDRDRVESVAAEVARRYDLPSAEVELLDADNWLSIPTVVGDEYFVKVITRQNSLVHTLLTTSRNLGAYSSGSEGFFQHVADPLEMAEQELDATRRMREIGINVPKPVEAFEHEGLGVLVMEYLPAFETLDGLPESAVREYAPELFEALNAMHQAGFAHGDLQSENVLIFEGELYVIDATSVDERNIRDARAYDLACALAVLEPLIGASAAVEATTAVCETPDLLTAGRFLDFVNIRPDHAFDAPAVKGELEKAASG